MSLAPQELENSASRYAAEAIRLDSEGSRGKAIQSYERAIEALVKLVQVYPEYKLNRIYMERASTYQNRVKALQMTHGLGGEISQEIRAPDLEEPVNTYRVKDKKTGSNIKMENYNEHSDSPDSKMVQESSKTDFGELLLKEKPEVSWEEVIGLEDAKRAIKESIVYPTKRPDLFPLGWPRGILLYGPPGCGKTLLAAAAAAEIEGYFINVDASSMMSKWLGEAEKNEVGGEVRVKNQFLTEMDGINGKSKESFLYVIGATNKPWTLEAGFLRRFQKRIYVSLPDTASRTNLFNQYTKPLKKDRVFKYEELAKAAEGYSASDIKDICQAAQLRVVDELFESGKAFETTSNPRAITMTDLKEIFKIRKPSVSLEMIRAYMRWSDQYRAL